MRPKVACHSSFHLQLPDKVAIEHVTEWAMSNIMDQASNCDILNLIVSDLQIWLRPLQYVHLFIGKITGSNTVLKSFVRGLRKHELATPKLMQVLQSLKCRRINNVPAELI
jgi:hypothetical protein